MKKMEQIYYIESYIPSDENRVHSDIKKLICIDKRYYWASIMYNCGIGFASKDYKGEPTIEDALIKLEGFRHGDSRIIKGSFFDAIEVMNKFEKLLSNDLVKA